MPDVMDIKIGDKTIGFDHQPYFIADIAANHDGELHRAFKLIELAKEAGADAAKFQHFKAARIVSKRGFENLGGQLSHQASWGKSVFEVYQDASINPDWTEKLYKKCREVDIEFFTSPYDYASVDLVDPFVEVYKIGSGDITWIDMLTYIAKKGKPVLLATGAASQEDVDRAVKAILFHNPRLALMQCNTNYTTEKDKHHYVNLNVLNTFKERYPGLVLGLSDHTLGIGTVVGSIALGARVIEKHFTDDNARLGPDHKFAMNPNNWRAMVDASLEVFEALGDGIKRIEENEMDSIVVQQRALRAVRDMQIGEVITMKDYEALRPMPSGSFQPWRSEELIGKALTKPIESGAHFTESHFNNSDD